MLDRRQVLGLGLLSLVAVTSGSKALLAANALPGVAYLSCARLPDGTFAVVMLDKAGSIVRSIPLSARGTTSPSTTRRARPSSSVAGQGSSRLPSISMAAPRRTFSHPNRTAISTATAPSRPTAVCSTRARTTPKPAQA